MDPVSILKELIAIPSVNPMGRDVSGPEFFEAHLSDFLCGFFDRLGVEFERLEPAPRRPNVIARWNSAAGRLTVLLDAHQDTVPTDGMIVDPFHPVEQDGRIYGRGACDVKGGLAAMLSAFARLVEERPPRAANVVISCTCDEEATVLGITDLVQLWSDPSRAGSLLSKPPDAAVVAEPTGLNVVVAHKGVTRWKIRTTGRACHSARPSEGVNAIYRMATVLNCLQEYAERLPQSISPHPLCGRPTLSVGRIEGGLSVNTVPDSCTIEVDRRVIPGEDAEHVIEDVAHFLRERLEFEIENLSPWLTAPPLADEHNGPWADRLLTHIEAVAGPHRTIGVPYGTHASRIAAAGVPAVVFGPGSVEQAHTHDEWISIMELKQAAEVYYRFCAQTGD